MRNKWIVIIIIFLLLVCTIVIEKNKNNSLTIKDYDIEDIKRKKELTILTINSSLSYFNYRGEEMGLQYDIAKRFAEFLGVKIKVKVATSTTDLIKMLANREGDLIAYNLPIVKDNKENVLFCGEKNITHQVLVQRNNKKNLITDVTELIGKPIYVNHKKHLERLRNLNEELGGGLIIKYVDNDSTTTEDLIMQVSRNEINYIVCDNDLASLNKKYYPNININIAVSFDQKSSWAVRKESRQLAKTANNWYSKFSTTDEYKQLLKRYFTFNKHILQHDAILSLKEGKISHFDDYFKKYASVINWDWRLIASLAYTESNFDTTAISWSGARGLMQLMPATARKMGVKPGKEHDAQESIKAAVKYLTITDKLFQKVPKEERVKFVLAAYNAGSGHIVDAMALAQKYGKNKYLWKDNVEKYILLKRHEEYYNDKVCKNGFFRGEETCNFVNDILNRYEIYKEKIKQ